MHFYEEEKQPNINRLHYECGLSARIIKYFSDAEDQEKKEG